MRSLFRGIASGKPDYAQMSDEVAKIVKGDFDFYHADMSRLGEARSVKFTGVDPRGLDDYEVTTATFSGRALPSIWVQTARLLLSVSIRPCL